MPTREPHLLGAAYGDIGEDADWFAETYDTKWWSCYRCSQPTLVIYPADPQKASSTFKCPHNQYAPIACGDNCPHFVAIPHYEELWTYEAP